MLKSNDVFTYRGKIEDRSMISKTYNKTLKEEMKNNE